MANSLPYLASNKNINALFERIASAKIPDKFNREFLTTTIGLKGSNDRSLIPLLRTMGFIDQSGTPTGAYRLLKGHERGRTIAEGVRAAYAPLFDSDHEANKLPLERIKGLIAQVAGVDADMTSRIAGTFSALVKAADFSGTATLTASGDNDGPVEQAVEPETPSMDRGPPKGLRSEFHYNLQIHLPTNASEETYLNIFNAMRKVFQ